METLKTKRSLAYAAAGAAGLVIGAGGVSGLEIHANAVNARGVQPFTHHIAANRNACLIDSVIPTVAFGKPALKVTIRLGSRIQPGDVHGAYDGVGMRTAFTDGTGNLENGVLVGTNDTRDPHKDQLILGGMPEDGPDSSTNSMAFPVPPYANEITDYQVYRENTVDAAVTGPLVADQHYHETARVQCGAFAYHPGSAPVIENN